MWPTEDNLLSAPDSECWWTDDNICDMRELQQSLEVLLSAILLKCWLSSAEHQPTKMRALLARAVIQIWQGRLESVFRKLGAFFLFPVFIALCEPDLFRLY
jgi:hypothetical protein